MIARGPGWMAVDRRWSSDKLDPNARDLTEDKRIPFGAPDQLLDLTRRAGFSTPDHTKMEAPAPLQRLR
jgi:hypothetical protein